MRFPRPGVRWITAVLLTSCLASLSPAWAQDGDAVATVNGRPISKRKMAEILWDAHGLAIMQQLIVLELAKDQTAHQNIKVTQADIDREFQRALVALAPEAGTQNAAAADKMRQEALDLLLQKKGISLAEFKLGMERNAHLRKLVEKDLRVDEPTLREEFARLYGEKVEVRSIQVNEVNALQEALNLLEKGTDFAEVAKRVSQESEAAQRGGLLEPFTFNDDNIAPVLREAAFALRPGEVTKPIKVGRWWFVWRLERRIPPADVRFEDVRTQVEQQLRDRVEPDEMNRLVTELFRKAEIRVLDRDLKPKYEELLKRNAAADAVGRP
jgi:foldase protein PrsA